MTLGSRARKPIPREKQSRRKAATQSHGAYEASRVAEGTGGGFPARGSTAKSWEAGSVLRPKGTGDGEANRSSNSYLRTRRICDRCYCTERVGEQLRRRS